MHATPTCTYVHLFHMKMNTVGLFILLFSLLMKSTYTEITPVEPRCYDLETPHVKRCCAGFRTIGEKCYPCVGSFGLECSKPCTDGYYGERCLKKCQCNTCNRITGECFYETTTSICIGSFGVGCTIPCPDGYYGKECQEKCTCENCESKTGSCLDSSSSGMSSVHISILVCSIAGAVFAGALIIFIRVKRKKSTTIAAHQFYLGESGPVADIASQSYMHLEDNIYNDIDSLHYLDPVDSIEKHNDIITRQEKPEDKRDKTAREKSSLLSLLMRRSNNCQFNMMDRGYIDIVESDSDVNPPISTSTTYTMATSSSMTPSEPPVRTTTEPSTRLKAKGTRTTRPQTPPVIQEETTTHPLLARKIRTQSPPPTETDLKAKIITKPSSVRPKNKPRFPFSIKSKLTKHLATKSEKPSSVDVALQSQIETTPPQSPNTIEGKSTNVTTNKPKTTTTGAFKPTTTVTTNTPQPTTTLATNTPQSTTTNTPQSATTNTPQSTTTSTPQSTTTITTRGHTVSAKIQQIISLYETVHRKE